MGDWVAPSFQKEDGVGFFFLMEDYVGFSFEQEGGVGFFFFIGGLGSVLLSK
jgi:hypothetical protein